MSFNKNRNSREDNSRKQRSNSESFKSKGNTGRNSSNPKSDRFERPSFKKDDNKSFGRDERKSSFGSDNRKTFEREDRKSFGKPSFGRDDKRSFNKDEKRPFGRPSKLADSKDKSFNSRGSKKFGNKSAEPTDAYQEQREKNDYKYTANRKFRPANKPAQKEAVNDGLIRLNRYISNAGICSRRKADELIAAGVVSVNGEYVTSLGTKVDPAKDEIRYNNERLKREKMVYVLLNKPKDYITTTDDPQERRTVMELVSKATKERIYPVGRLDRNTTGLLLLTNDGNLAEKLSHPRNNVTKIYQVELNKNLAQGDFNKIQFGLELEDGFIKPDDLSYVTGASKREVGIQIHSGKNRIVRRIFESLGYEVIKLDRVVYANLTKKDLPRGRWRFLEERELLQLKHFVK